jgi:hypothetical protein
VSCSRTPDFVLDLEIIQAAAALGFVGFYVFDKRHKLIATMTQEERLDRVPRAPVNKPNTAITQ